MEEKEPLIVVDGISLRYGAEGKSDSTMALSDINLNIYDGDFICVLGPSGCGKSTLLNIIAGLLEPTSGEIIAKGEAASGIDYRRAVVFQAPVLYPWMNVRENVSFGPRVRGVDKEETRKVVDKYLDLVGLTDFAESKPYELSGGMRQRAALARELVNDPYMILLDEPFGALDALTKIAMQNELKRIQREFGTTMILVTHDIDEAVYLADRVIVFSSRPGRIRQIIPVELPEPRDRNSYEFLEVRRSIFSQFFSPEESRQDG